MSNDFKKKKSKISRNEVEIANIVKMYWFRLKDCNLLGLKERYEMISISKNFTKNYDKIIILGWKIADIFIFACKKTTAKHEIQPDNIPAD